MQKEVTIMGIYLNPQGTDFEEALNSEIYVDKSGLIKYTNKVLRTKQKYICVSRPRRFGKSIAVIEPLFYGAFSVFAPVFIRALSRITA